MNKQSSKDIIDKKSIEESENLKEKKKICILSAVIFPI